MPNFESRLSVAVLVHPQVSLGLALLIAELFRKADALGAAPRFEANLVGFGRLRLPDGLEWAGAPPRGNYNVVIVPPFAEGFDGDLQGLDRETAWVAEQSRSGSLVATACLGALIPASAGLLNGWEATTHWKWHEYVQERFPAVRWRLQKMLCASGAFLTAGGYLATIDLCLSLISRHAPPQEVQELTRRILADTIRQKQSVYAQSLTLGAEGPLFRGLESWVSENLSRPLGLDDLMERYPMSRRNLHRRFLEQFGLTPGKYLQLKRVEKAQALLRESEWGVEQILQAVGLQDTTSFRRVFQREIGLSPAQYRRMVRDRGNPPQADRP